MVAVGSPVVSIPKLNALPTLAVVDIAEVKEGAWVTVRVKCWTTGVPLAVGGDDFEGVDAAGAAAGDPVMVAVPLPAVVNASRLGNGTLSDTVGAG